MHNRTGGDLLCCPVDMLIDQVHQNNKLVLLALKPQQTRIFENI